MYNKHVTYFSVYWTVCYSLFANLITSSFRNYFYCFAIGILDSKATLRSNYFHKLLCVYPPTPLQSTAIATDHLSVYKRLKTKRASDSIFLRLWSRISCCSPVFPSSHRFHITLTSGMRFEPL